MKKSKASLAIFASAVAGSIALVWLGRGSRTAADPGLPPMHAYATLPPSFTDALNVARAEVHGAGERTALRNLAQLYLANRLSSEARRCYDLLARTPGGLDAHDRYFLAQLVLDAGELTDAQKHLDAVVAQEPTYLPARLLRADVLFKSGQEEAAVAEYQAVLARDPASSSAAVGLARIELQRGQDEQATRRLEAVVAAHPESASASALLAQVLGRRGETERAAALRQQMRHDPVATDPWLDPLWTRCYDKQRLALRFEEYFFAGQMEDARGLVARLEQIDSGNWIPAMFKGWSEARAGRADAAVAEYRAALSKGGDPERIGPLVSAALMSRPAEAKAAMAEFYAKKPDSIPILTAYADAAVRAGDRDTSLKLLRQLVRREPYLYKPNLDLARLLWTTNREEAVECLLHVVKVFPVDVASRGLLAEHYFERADFAAAAPILEQAVPATPKESAAYEKLRAMLHSTYTHLGVREVEAGHLETAEAFYAKAVKLGPDVADTLAAAAGVSAQLQHYGPATDALKRLAILQPSNPTIPLSLGDMFYQAGQKEAARDQWLRAQQLASGANAELKTAIEQRVNGHISAEMFR